MKTTQIFAKITWFLLVGWAVSGMFSGVFAHHTERSAAQEPPKILMMIADGFNADEFWDPYFAFQALGYQVDVAVPERRLILSGNKNDGILDFPGELLLDQVQPEQYVGFFLTGGKSPEKLEEYPRALEICQYFDREARPLSTLCHGPRLLAKAGLLQGRNVTYLFRVRDEIPETFAVGGLGFYTDRPLVEDGNLLTARFPQDVEGLLRRSFEKFGEHGGITPPQVQPRVLVVDAGADRLYAHAFVKAGLSSLSSRENLVLSIEFVLSFDYQCFMLKV